MLYGYNVTKSNWSAGQRFIFLKFLKSKMNKKRRKKTLHSDSISMQGKNSESAHDKYFIDIDIAIAINIDLGSCEHTIAISLIVVIINLWFVVVSVNQLFMQIRRKHSTCTCIVIDRSNSNPEYFGLFGTTILHAPVYFLFRPFLGYINMIFTIHEKILLYRRIICILI